jgi:hypothetical protein
MLIQSPKRILAADFKEDDKDVAGRLGGLLNSYLEELHTLSTKNINIQDNLNQFIKNITVTVNSSGVPTQNIGFQNNLNTRISGTQVIRAFGNSPVISQPFISFVEREGSIIINHIAGLIPNVEYQLVVLVIGN